MTTPFPRQDTENQAGVTPLMPQNWSLACTSWPHVLSHKHRSFGFSATPPLDKHDTRLHRGTNFIKTLVESPWNLLLVETVTKVHSHCLIAKSFRDWQSWRWRCHFHLWKDNATSVLVPSVVTKDTIYQTLQQIQTQHLLVRVQTAG